MPTIWHLTLLFCSAAASGNTQKVTEKLDVDDFLNGGFATVHADSDVSSQGGESDTEAALSEQSEPESMEDDLAGAEAAQESTSESDGGFLLVTRHTHATVAVTGTLEWHDRSVTVAAHWHSS